MIISIFVCCTHIHMFGYIFQYHFLCFTFELHTRSRFFFLYFYLLLHTCAYKTVATTTIKMTTTTNWIGYIYIPTHSYIINSKRHQYTGWVDTYTHWLMHIANISGSFAKKALVQTIVCLVLRKYRRKKTDRQADMHTHDAKEGETERASERQRGKNWANTYFGNESERKLEHTNLIN